MRSHYVKNSPQILAASEYVEQEPFANRGKWRESLGIAPEAPLCLEIGCGKGRFLEEMARQEPDAGWIGLERISSVLCRAAQRMDALAEDQAPHHLRLIRAEALQLGEIFADGEISRIYLNFSDPWPKVKHYKRRLTSDRFLPIYRRIMTPDGCLQLKTDSDDLFAFSLQSLAEDGWRIGVREDDLQASPYAGDNIMTEYEIFFTAQGKPIHLLRAFPPVSGT